MRIAGEIVNSRSAAADLTQSRSTRSATRRLDTNAGDSYRSLSPARPFRLADKHCVCLKSCPKTGTYRSLRSSNRQPRCLSAGTFSNIDLWFLRRAPSASGLCLSAPVARAFLAIGPIIRSIEEERRMQVLVRDNNVDQALKVLKKKMQREGGFREMKPAATTKNPPRGECGKGGGDPPCPQARSQKAAARRKKTARVKALRLAREAEIVIAL